MSLSLIKKNSSSPFHLQRSIVPQTEGAYQDGGYNPKAVYNNDAANEAVVSFSKTVGAALSNIDLSKKKKEKPVEKIKPGGAPNKPEKIIDINELSKTGNYSDYSEQSMIPLNKEEKQRKGFELARSRYEKQQEEEQKKKNPLSGFYF
jgi:hypothetical protein